VKEQFGIAIPAYKDAARLRKCLESIERVDADLLATTSVVDDSGDGQVAAKLSADFPKVTWFVHELNLGFATAANRAVLECRAEWVFLLNDDTELLRDPRPALESITQHEDIFAVSLQSMDEAGGEREGAKRLVWRFGIAKVLHNKSDQAELVDGVSQSAYAVGGHAVYDRKKFSELNGFDEMFHPFYWEDVDLCERARQRGWKTLYCADAKILHKSSGAIRTTHRADEIRIATWRNRLLFSSRHARGVHRLVFLAGVAWHSVTATISKDRAKQQAIAEFRNMAAGNESTSREKHGSTART
jgi:GT2 family glycosyltransferase